MRGLRAGQMVQQTARAGRPRCGALPGCLALGLLLAAGCNMDLVLIDLRQDAALGAGDAADVADVADVPDAVRANVPDAKTSWQDLSSLCGTDEPWLVYNFEDYAIIQVESWWAGPGSALGLTVRAMNPQNGGLDLSIIIFEVPTSLYPVLYSDSTRMLIAHHEYILAQGLTPDCALSNEVQYDDYLHASLVLLSSGELQLCLSAQAMGGSCKQDSGCGGECTIYGVKIWLPRVPWPE